MVCVRGCNVKRKWDRRQQATLDDDAAKDAPQAGDVGIGCASVKTAPVPNYDVFATVAFEQFYEKIVL